MNKRASTQVTKNALKANPRKTTGPKRLGHAKPLAKHSKPRRAHRHCLHARAERSKVEQTCWKHIEQARKQALQTESEDCTKSSQKSQDGVGSRTSNQITSRDDSKSQHTESKKGQKDRVNMEVAKTVSTDHSQEESSTRAPSKYETFAQASTHTQTHHNADKHQSLKDHPGQATGGRRPYETEVVHRG